jgi:PAS domain S-box-containing protein
VDYDSFLDELRQVQSRTSMLVRNVKGTARVDQAAVQQMLAEFDTIVEELRVTDEEVRVLNDQLVETGEVLSADRDRYRDLFDLAPAAYLVTDRVGVIRDANQRATSMLGVAQRFLIGRPLVMLVAVEDRWVLRDRLRQLGGVDADVWQLRLQPRKSEPIPVVMITSVGRGPAGELTELRWLLLPLPSISDAEPQPSTTPSGAFPSMLSVPSWDDLPERMHQVGQAAAPLLRADGAGVMVADRDGVLRWVTGSGRSEQTLERAQRDLGEGPCIDAFTSGDVVGTADLWIDPRWPRLGPAARTNRLRGVLSAPVVLDGRTVGTCNALTFGPRAWSDADVGAIRAYAAMLGQLIGSASDARHKGELAVQLQVALDSRVLIEQAKGILMERHSLDEQAAFTRLRRMARSSSRKLTEVAREIILSR